MAALKDEVKLFAIQALACFDTPSDVKRQIKEKFAVEVTLQQLQAYNPSTVAGARMSTKLRTLFEATRKKFVEDVSEIPIAHQAYRLRVINRMVDRVAEQGNVAMVGQLLEQAAKEVGGAFTNRHKHELMGKDGKPIKTETVGSIVTTVDPVEAARMYQDFAAGD